MEERTWMKAIARFEMIQKVEHGVLKMREAAGLLDITVRHLRRLCRRAEKEGVRGLIYRRRHEPWNKTGEEDRARIIALRKERYGEFNIAHFRDMLSMRHDIELSREALRRILGKANLLNVRKVRRRKPKHRLRFEAPRAGILVQRDTSIHCWLPAAERPWKLILDLDDHSRMITGAVFSEHDDVLSNMLVCWETVSTHGLPFTYYTDNNPIYNPKNHKPRHGMYQLFRMRHGDVEETLSQWKRALHELGIECIHARPYQPQGKGKIERIFRFFQDRLVKEMADAKVSTIAQGNKYLRKWIRWYNRCHVHSGTKSTPEKRFFRNNAFRRMPPGKELDQIFCLKYDRIVKSDNTFEFEGKTYQIKANAYRVGYAKAKVELRIYLTGKMRVFYKNREIAAYPYKPSQNLRFLPGEDILPLR